MCVYVYWSSFNFIAALSFACPLCSVVSLRVEVSALCTPSNWKILKVFWSFFYYTFSVILFLLFWLCICSGRQGREERRRLSGSPWTPFVAKPQKWLDKWSGSRVLRKAIHARQQHHLTVLTASLPLSLSLPAAGATEAVKTAAAAAAQMHVKVAVMLPPSSIALSLSLSHCCATSCLYCAVGSTAHATLTASHWLHLADWLPVCPPGWLPRCLPALFPSFILPSCSLLPACLSPPTASTNCSCPLIH